MPNASTTRARAALYRILQKISERLEPPEVLVSKLKFEPATTAAVVVAIEAGWINGLSDGSPHTPRELCQPGQSPELLIRIFRVLTSSRLVAEAGRETYKANEKTRLLFDAGVQTGISSWFDNMAPAFVHMPAYFAANGYQEPVTQENGPYADVFKAVFWDRVNATPKLKKDLDTYMMAHKKGGSSLADLVPLSALRHGLDKQYPVLLVDVGGGKGHQATEFRQRFPALQGEVIVQDFKATPEVISAGVKGMQHDFFKTQPVKHARYYYYSAILHDWPDAECVSILKRAAEAMQRGYSRVLINGIILRETKPTYFEACKDLGMMAAMSAKERTLPQVVALAKTAGLAYVGSYTNPKADNGIIEFELSSSGSSGQDSASSDGSK